MPDPRRTVTLQEFSSTFYTAILDERPIGTVFTRDNPKQWFAHQGADDPIGPYETKEEAAQVLTNE